MGHGDPVAYEAIRRGVKVGLGIVSHLPAGLLRSACAQLKQQDCASILSTEMFPAMHFALQWERGNIPFTTSD